MVVAGVHKIMVTGTTVQSSKEALRLTRLFPETLYSTAGQPLGSLLFLYIIKLP